MEGELDRDMTPRLIGETYMRKATENSPRRTRYGLYECPFCEKEFECSVESIKSGNTKSCGCQQYMPREKSVKHGLRKHRFYSTWVKMVHRCSNSNYTRYKDYGGRGITVCEEWLDVRNFVVWAEATHPNIEGLSLDRIDNDKGYSPENCRWADASTQNINQRIKKSNTSGFVGVDFRPNENKYVARITVLGVRVYIGYYETIEEAVLARDNYITQNNLPHKLSTDYKREESL